MIAVEQPVRRTTNPHYPISIRQEAVRLVHTGRSLAAVTAQFSLGQTTLRKWVHRAELAPTLSMRAPRLTPTQKHHLVRELRDGRLTEEEALVKYGVRLKRTLRTWVAAQSAAEAAALPAGALSPDPIALPEAAVLATQLRQAQWQLEALHTLIDQAEATYHIDIRKKAGAKPSK
ncbi:MAG: IS630 transposase-related protein [Janthinobacterium lividum]